MPFLIYISLLMREMQSKDRWKKSDQMARTFPSSRQQIAAHSIILINHQLSPSWWSIVSRSIHFISSYRHRVAFHKCCVTECSASRWAGSWVVDTKLVPEITSLKLCEAFNLSNQLCLSMPESIERQTLLWSHQLLTNQCRTGHDRSQTWTRICRSASRRNLAFRCAMIGIFRNLRYAEHA